MTLHPAVCTLIGVAIAILVAPFILCPLGKFLDWWLDICLKVMRRKSR